MGPKDPVAPAAVNVVGAVPAKITDVRGFSAKVLLPMLVTEWGMVTEVNGEFRVLPRKALHAECGHGIGTAAVSDAGGDVDHRAATVVTGDRGAASAEGTLLPLRVRCCR